MVPAWPEGPKSCEVSSANTELYAVHSPAAAPASVRATLPVEIPRACSLTSFRSLSTCHLLSEASLTTPCKIILLSSRVLMSDFIFIFLHSPYHHLLENIIYLFFFFIVSFLRPNVVTMRAGHFYAFCSLLCSQCPENVKHIDIS